MHKLIALPRRHRPVPRGFTLTEVMVVMSIAAVTAAMALPAYTDHAVRGRIAEATGNLGALRAKAEQYFLEHRTYAGFTLPTLADARYFSYEVSTAAATYTISATGIAEQGMGGFAYTISRGNARWTTALPSGWTGVNSNCWVVGKGGAC
jgi:type IV pilus assembly protein PilE